MKINELFFSRYLTIGEILEGEQSFYYPKLFLPVHSVKKKQFADCRLYSCY